LRLLGGRAAFFLLGGLELEHFMELGVDGNCVLVDELALGFDAGVMGATGAPGVYAGHDANDIIEIVGVHFAFWGDSRGFYCLGKTG
jgi:hypothetical protein